VPAGEASHCQTLRKTPWNGSFGKSFLRKYKWGRSAMIRTKSLSCKTIGDLKKIIAGIPDDTRFTAMDFVLSGIWTFTTTTAENNRGKGLVERSESQAVKEALWAGDAEDDLHYPHFDDAQGPLISLIIELVINLSHHLTRVRSRY
jgi:hypothetical protein